MNSSKKMQGGAAIWWVLAIVVVVIAAFVAWRWYQHAPQSGAPEAISQPASSAPAPVSTAPQYPVSAIAGSTPAPASTAPQLAPEEGDLLDSVAALPGGDHLSDLLKRPDLIQHIVATVDALPGKKLSPKVLPIKRPAGEFRVDTRKGSTVIAASNAARYAPYLQALGALDTATLVSWYKRHYAQFEQAYRQLGYPDGHFNDRLVVVIDNLLATPKLQQPPVLLAHKNGWVYADANLESLSAGQKLMLRLPPTGQARVRARLREARAVLTGTQMPID